MRLTSPQGPCLAFFKTIISARSIPIVKSRVARMEEILHRTGVRYMPYGQPKPTVNVATMPAAMNHTLRPGSTCLPTATTAVNQPSGYEQMRRCCG